MLALTSATGKLGSAVLKALLENNLITPSELVVSVSHIICSPIYVTEYGTNIGSRRPQILQTPDGILSVIKALAFVMKGHLKAARNFSWCQRPVSRWTSMMPSLVKAAKNHHMVSINAARKAGVRHVYYTSLAFGSKSKAAVMRAHLRTEEYLASLNDIGYTVIREGLYNEYWPLYFGHYDVPSDQRKEIIVAGDGKISWTAIQDLGLGTALILAAPTRDYSGQMLYLSSLTTKSPTELAQTVSEIKGEEVKLKIVSQEEYVNYYIRERGMDEGHEKWWASTYAALEDGECDIHDGTLENLLRIVGHLPKPVEATVREMLRSQ